MYLHNFILEAFTCYITCSTIVDKTNVTCSSSEINFSFIKSLRVENKRWFSLPPFIVLSWQLRVRHWSSNYTIHFNKIISKPLLVHMWWYYTVGFRYICANSLSMKHQRQKHFIKYWQRLRNSDEPLQFHFNPVVTVNHNKSSLRRTKQFSGNHCLI